MQNNKYFVFLVLLVLTTINVYSQAEDITSPPEREKPYALLLYVSGGLGYFPSNQGAPDYLHPKISRINAVSTARIMWKPDHRVKVGLETGYITFYSYKLTSESGQKGKVSLNAVPVLLEFSVSVKKHFNLFAGPGVYVLNTNLDYEGKTISKKVSTGWMGAAAYTWPISKKVSIGTEAKWLYASETTRGVFGVQLQMVYKFLKW